MDFYSEALVIKPGQEGVVQIYVSHKYTTTTGGGQANSCADAIKYLLGVQGAEKDDNVLFLAILDGDYYQKRGRNGKTRIDNLRAHYETINIRICTSVELMAENLLLNYLVDITS